MARKAVIQEAARQLLSHLKSEGEKLSISDDTASEAGLARHLYKRTQKGSAACLYVAKLEEAVA